MARKLSIAEAMAAARVVAQLRTMPGWTEGKAVDAARRLAKANRIDKDGKIRPHLKIPGRCKCPPKTCKCRAKGN